MANENPEEELDRAPLARIARSRAWLVPALAVAILLFAVVYVGRSGNANPSPSPGPTQPSVALNIEPDTPPPTAVQTARPLATHVIATVAPPPPSPVSSFAERVGGLRFVDGLPTFYNGQPVIRVEDALKRPVGQSLFVAGWFSPKQCEPDSPYCLSATLSDSPAGGVDASMMVTGMEISAGDTGPRILQGTTTQQCSTATDPNCAIELDVANTVWMGDPLTDADPLSTVSLLTAFSGGVFTGIDFKPFEESTSCPLQWPSQSYRATSPSVSRADQGSLPVELVLLFPSTVERIDDQGAIEQAAQNISSSDVALRCVAISQPVGPDSWVARDNVLLLLGDDSADVAQQVRDALNGAS